MAKNNSVEKQELKKILYIIVMILPQETLHMFLINLPSGRKVFSIKVLT